LFIGAGQDQRYGGVKTVRAAWDGTAASGGLSIHVFHLPQALLKLGIALLQLLDLVGYGLQIGIVRCQRVERIAQQRGDSRAPINISGHVCS